MKSIHLKFVARIYFPLPSRCTEGKKIKIKIRVTAPDAFGKSVSFFIPGDEIPMTKREIRLITNRFNFHDARNLIFFYLFIFQFWTLMGDILVTYLVALVMHILFEAPILRLDRTYFTSSEYFGRLFLFVIYARSKF